MTEWVREQDAIDTIFALKEVRVGDELEIEIPEADVSEPKDFLYGHHVVRVVCICNPEGDMESRISWGTRAKPCAGVLVNHKGHRHIWRKFIIGWRRP